MNKKVGKLIKRKREHLKLTQEDLGKMLNVSPSTISNWETNTNFPEKEIIPKLCKILKIKEKSFYYEEERKFETYTLTEMSKKNRKKIKLLKFIALYLITFILISTISTICINTMGLFQENLVDIKIASIENYIDINDEIKKQADDNLNKIKTSANTNFSEENKEKLVANLEKMSKNCDLLKNYDLHAKTNYEYTIKSNEIKDILSGVNYETDSSIDIKVLSTISKIDSRDKEEKNKEEAYQLFQKRVVIELELFNGNIDTVFPEYQYVNLNNIYKIITFSSRYMGFSYDKYYLALTEYAMKVGGINE